MNELKRNLERYLKSQIIDKKGLSIVEIDKLPDGWESDNYHLTIEYGIPLQRADWVWRIYSGEGSHAKAEHEFTSMGKLLTAGYPVPRVILMADEGSPGNRPYILMEYIQGQAMWDMLSTAPADRQARLIDQFCELFVRLHSLDWKQFSTSLADPEPFFFIDRWLSQASQAVQVFPEVGVDPFLDWVFARRELLHCQQPSPVHQDFHPGNILIAADDTPYVIDWTGFDVTDSRFDLAWTLVLTYAHGSAEWRDQIFQGYQDHLEGQVEQMEAFEAIACARRLVSVVISLKQGAQRLGMNSQAVESMRATMAAHQRVYSIFLERTGLRIRSFEELF